MIFWRGQIDLYFWKCVIFLYHCHQKLRSHGINFWNHLFKGYQDISYFWKPSVQYIRGHKLNLQSSNHHYDKNFHNHNTCGSLSKIIINIQITIMSDKTLHNHNPCESLSNIIIKTTTIRFAMFGSLVLSLVLVSVGVRGQVRGICSLLYDVAFERSVRGQVRGINVAYVAYSIWEVKS